MDRSRQIRKAPLVQSIEHLEREKSMTETKSFSFGANERSWWAEYESTLPQRKAMEEEKRQLVARMEAEQQRQEALQYSGPALFGIIAAYAAKNQPAVTTQVARDFVARGFPEDEFRNVLEQLKAMGRVTEVTSSTQGYMGERTTHLYLLDG